MEARIAQQRASVLAMQFFRVCGDLTDQKAPLTYDINSVLDSLKEACASAGMDVIETLKTAGSVFVQRHPEAAERVRMMFIKG